MNTVQESSYVKRMGIDRYMNRIEKRFTLKFPMTTLTEGRVFLSSSGESATGVSVSLSSSSLVKAELYSESELSDSDPDLSKSDRSLLSDIRDS